MKVFIKFLGKTRSGRYSKYEVVDSSGSAVAAAQFKKLTDEGVKPNANVGTNCFLMATHYFKTPEIGKFAEADVCAYENDDAEKINFIKGINREKQAAFVQKMKDAPLIARAQSSLDSGLGSTDLFKIDNLLAEKKLLEARIAALTAAE